MNSCILVLDIFWYSANNWQLYSGIGYILPTIGGYILIWTYSANNWEIYVNYGVFVHPRAQGCRLCIYWNVHLFKKNHILQLYTLQST